MSWIKRFFGREDTMAEEPQRPWKATEPDEDATQAIRPGGLQPPTPEEQPASGAHGEHEAQFDAVQAAIERSRVGDQQSFAEAEDRLARNPVTDSGVHFMGVPGLAATPGAGVGADDTAGERCAMCGGIIPGDHELLTELLGWLAPAGESFVHQFYIDLFEAQPDLRTLFPEQIEIQEEKLLTAIVSLLQLFKAGDDQMEQLDSALAKYGRSHTRFDPAATIEEYAAVWQVLAGVATRMLADKLTPRHVAALRRAYEYAAGKMLAAQATAKLSGKGRRRRTV